MLLYLLSASFIIAMILYIMGLFYYPAIKTMQTGLFHFVPLLFMILAYSFIRTALCPGFLTFAKVLSAILNIFIIGILQVILSFCVLFVIQTDYEEMISRDIKVYSRLLKSASKFETKHFPTVIPPDSKNAKVYKNTGGIFGSETVILSFEIDKEYIDSELKKYKFIKTEGPYLTDDEYTNNSIRYYAVNHLNLKKSNFKFYVIGNNATNKNNFPLEYGIALNDKTNTILYYYKCLD